MAIQIKREGASPNLLKYSVIADADGGELTLTRNELMRDCIPGPLKRYLNGGAALDPESACQFLLCNPAMRAFVTPRSLARVAIDATVEGDESAIALRLMADPNGSAIVALEFRHTIAA